MRSELSLIQAKVRTVPHSVGVRSLFSCAYPHGGVRPFHQKSTCLTQITLGPYVVQIWSRTPRISAGSKPSNSTVWEFYGLQSRQSYPERKKKKAAVERIWHVYGSQGQIPALAFRQGSFTYFKLFPLHLEAD